MEWIEWEAIRKVNRYMLIYQIHLKGFSPFKFVPIYVFRVYLLYVYVNLYVFWTMYSMYVGCIILSQLYIFLAIHIYSCILQMKWELCMQWALVGNTSGTFLDISLHKYTIQFDFSNCLFLVTTGMYLYNYHIRNGIC